MITGKRVTLKQLEQFEMPEVLGILQNDEVNRYLLQGIENLTTSNCLGYLSATGYWTTCMAMGIYENSTGNIVGIIVVNNIHPVNQSANVRFLAVEKSHWGQGYGHDALTLMFKTLCLDKNIKRVTSTTLTSNKIAGVMHEEIGARAVGFDREAVFYGGNWHDVKRWELLAREINWDLFKELEPEEVKNG